MLFHKQQDYFLKASSPGNGDSKTPSKPFFAVESNESSLLKKRRTLAGAYMGQQSLLRSCYVVSAGR